MSPWELIHRLGHSVGLNPLLRSPRYRLYRLEAWFSAWDLRRVEERMRVQHEWKSKKLKRLDEKGAEAHKIDVTRNLVRSLSSKIRIAIQVVDKISVTINKLRDEELWSLINKCNSVELGA
nr:nitrate regulatory gene2 protein-like [Ipomoea batatas]